MIPNKSGKLAGTEGWVTGNLRGLLSGITSLTFRIPCVAKIQKPTWLLFTWLSHLVPNSFKGMSLLSCHVACRNLSWHSFECLKLFSHSTLKFLLPLFFLPSRAGYYSINNNKRNVPEIKESTTSTDRTFKLPLHGFLANIVTYGANAKH